jgi:hypothetical protein
MHRNVVDTGTRKSIGGRHFQGEVLRVDWKKTNCVKVDLAGPSFGRLIYPELDLPSKLHFRFDERDGCGGLLPLSTGTKRQGDQAKHEIKETSTPLHEFQVNAADRSLSVAR